MLVIGESDAEELMTTCGAARDSINAMRASTRIALDRAFDEYRPRGILSTH